MKHSKMIVGVDIAKQVFQLRWVEYETGEMMNLQLKRYKFLEHFVNHKPCLEVILLITKISPLSRWL